MPAFVRCAPAPPGSLPPGAISSPNPTARFLGAAKWPQNGGVRRDGRVVFAVTDLDHPRWPNLWDFADLFRALGCEDALFLDGDLSQMVVDPPGEIPSGNYFGAIFVVVE